MKDILLSILRDRNTGAAEFRKASDQLAHILCAETFAKLADGVYSVQTPLGTARGVSMPKDVMAVAIMRAGLSLLPAFTQAMPDIGVGMIGVERDEATAKANVYYRKFPAKSASKAVILDPMLATGGSACLAVELLVEQGFEPDAIYFTGVIAAQEGLERLARAIPERNIVVAAVDPDLNDRKFIVPGLGDYGDRYFGT
jgi:uracil phosphoribosyltransferase